MAFIGHENELPVDTFQSEFIAVDKGESGQEDCPKGLIEMSQT